MTALIVPRPSLELSDKIQEKRPHTIRGGKSHPSVTAMLQPKGIPKAQPPRRHTVEIRNRNCCRKRFVNSKGRCLAASPMKVLIATDAWHPQVNGVVRTLGSLARASNKLGVDVEFLSPDGFPSFQLPTYPGLRLAIPNRRALRRQSPTPSISRPRGRLALPCAPIAGAEAALSRRAIRRASRNTFPPARPFRRAWFTACCAGFTPGRR